MKAVVEFVMGSGDRAMTYVGREENGKWRELRMTHYASIADAGKVQEIDVRTLVRLRRGLECETRSRNNLEPPTPRSLTSRRLNRTPGGR
jgi:hypothetical protein